MFGLKSHFVFVPNGIDAKRYYFSEPERDGTRKALGIDANAQVFLNVGRLSKQKNQLFLVSVFSKYLHDAPNSYLLLLGVGEQRQALQSEIERMHLESRILLLGAREDISRFYSAADCFLFPSIYEGLGIVLVEAQANGLQCIASSAVPHEVEIVPIVDFLGLNHEEWINEMKIKGKRHFSREDRERYGKLVADSNFSQKKSVAIVQTLLLGLVKSRA